MAEIQRKTFPWGGEPLACVQGTLGEGQPLAEVSVWGEEGCEPISQPSYLVFRGEVQVVQPDTCL